MDADPGRGADKVPTFVSLIGAKSSLRVATLIDFQKSNAQTVENLYKRKLLDRNHVLTFVDFTGKAEADIEDMFDPDFYLRLVNEEYKNQLVNPITQTVLNMNYPRILVSIEDYLTKKRPEKWVIQPLPACPLLHGECLGVDAQSFACDPGSFRGGVQGVK